jgi:hypothetical protein
MPFLEQGQPYDWEAGPFRTFGMGESISPFEDIHLGTEQNLFLPNTMYGYFALFTGEELPPLAFRLEASRRETGRVIRIVAGEKALIKAGVVKSQLIPETKGYIQTSGFNEFDHSFFSHLSVRLDTGEEQRTVTPNMGYLAAGRIFYDQHFRQEGAEEVLDDIHFTPISDNALLGLRLSFAEDGSLPRTEILPVVRDAFAPLEPLPIRQARDIFQACKGELL